MKLLFLMIGSPGCGKDYFLEKEGVKHLALGADDIRIQVQTPELTIDGEFKISQKNDRVVWETLFSLLEKRMQNGETTFINACHSKPSDFSKYKELAERHRYRMYGIDLRDVPIDTAKKQNAQRPEYKRVPEFVIDNIYARFKNHPPPNYITLIKSHELKGVLDIQPLDISDKYDKVVVFGDLHSCYDPLAEYFQLNPEKDENLYLFLGDYFDRGPQTKEMLEFLMVNKNKKNFKFLIGNHEAHIFHYAFDENPDNIRSKEFLDNTLPEIVGRVSFAELREFCRKTILYSYFKFGDKVFYAGHGGLPLLKDLSFVSARQIIKGVGFYTDTGKIMDIWNAQMPETHYQFHGHRNILEHPIQTGRVFNLDNGVEFGGNLRIVEILKWGFNLVEIKNHNVRTNINRYSKPLTIIGSPEAPIHGDPNDLVTKFRASKTVQEKIFGDISSFNYTRKVFYDQLWNPLNTLARSFFINNKTNEIVARAWSRAFNFCEVDETKPENMEHSLHYPVFQSIKYNGFLGLLGYDKASDRLIFATKSSIQGDFSAWFQEIFKNNHAPSMDKIKDYLRDHNSNLVFEVLDLVNDPHIIDEGPKRRVVLLDCFERTTEIRKVYYDRLRKLAGDFGLECRLVRAVYGDWESLKEELNRLKDAPEEIEGYLFEDAKGFMFKYKIPFYKQWRYLRTVKEQMEKGQNINYSALTSPLFNDFVGFIKKFTREELAQTNIIALRKDFQKCQTANTLSVTTPVTTI